ncbi:glycosyltransferase family 2 protein [Enterococcus mundtii]|uniref:glycosyltransferase family 2 protein n=1 Tax=Enterococcus mundtii TaxID=53346 RepID=UPI001897ACEF|nr:glycosyltransferase family 2 protein [Enterococcus mundtii]MDB7100869.1 glycosyltransferase family 2 protein [Enterococcus mundtii]
MRKIFSVIIPVYNGEKTIYSTLMSCLRQTYSEFEVLVIDNLSTDKTKQIVQKISDERINYKYIEQKGRSHARNIGITLAKNKYLLFLDADDEIDSNLFMRAKKILEKGSYSGYCFGTYYNKQNNKQIIRKPLVNWKRIIEVYNPFPINSLIIENSVVQPFNEKFEYNEDWLFWYENSKNINIYVDLIYDGAIVNIHGENTMSNIKLMTENEMLVRSLIKKDLEYIKRMKNIIYYLKFMCFYLLLSDRTKTIEVSIRKNFPFIYTFVKWILKIPFIRIKISEILEIKKKSNPIMYN